jgi:amino acid transporter
VVVTDEIIFVVPTDVSYMVGTSAAWIPSSKAATLVLTGAVMAGITFVAIRGLKIGKWLHNAGSLLILTAYVILLGLPVWALLRGSIYRFEPLPLKMPKLDWFSLAVFGQMCVGSIS